MNTIAQNTNISRRAWLIWGVAALFVLFQFLLQASTTVMIPCLEQAFSISVLGIAWLSSSFFYSYIVLQIPSGIMTDRIGARRLLLLCLILCSLLCIIFGATHHFNVALLTRVAMGVVTAPAVACTLFLAANWFDAKQFALLAGLTEALGMLGGAIGEAMLAHCVDGFGWRNTMYSLSVVSILLAVAVYCIVKDRPDSSVKTLAISQLSIIKQLNTIIELPQVWLAGLYASLVFAVVPAFAALWCVPYLEVRYVISLDMAALGSSLIFIGIVVGGPVLGWLTDKIGRRKPVMMVASIIALLLILVILYLPLNLIAMFIALSMLGFFIGSYVVPFALVSDITPKHCRATAMGFTNMMCIVIGAPILQPFIAWMLKHNWDHVILNNKPVYAFHDYQMALTVLPICLLLSLVLLFFIKETHCQAYKA